MKNLNIIQLIIIILIIIILTPFFISKIYISDYFDYTNTGQIGDTIGGITSPFINGLAALLVFITFKEQVKANKLIQEQIYFQHIQEQINRLEEDFLKISTISDDINSKISSSIYEESRIIGNEIPYNISVNERSLNKIMYSTTIFNQIIKSIDRVDTKENKIFFQEKLKLLFKIVYKKNYSEIVISFNKALEHNCKQKKYIDEIVQEMSKLNNYFSK
jgi:hypothetical protein